MYNSNAIIVDSVIKYKSTYSGFSSTEMIEQNASQIDLKKICKHSRFWSLDVACAFSSFNV